MMMDQRKKRKNSLKTKGRFFLPTLILGNSKLRQTPQFRPRQWVVKGPFSRFPLIGLAFTTNAV